MSSNFQGELNDSFFPPQAGSLVEIARDDSSATIAKGAAAHANGGQAGG